MEIKDELREAFLSEFEFIAKRIEEEKDASKKLYFFSAAYAAIERLMRQCPNKELFISHAILNLCYGTINDRINRIKAGDANVPLPTDWSVQVVTYLKQFAEALQNNTSVYPALENFVQLGYFASGPGYYTQVLDSYRKSKETEKEG
jgi:hypothetical protein